MRNSKVEEFTSDAPAILSDAIAILNGLQDLMFPLNRESYYDEPTRVFRTRLEELINRDNRMGYKITHSNPQKLVRRAFFLAYEACGGPAGMGFLQAVDKATEEDVWNNIVCAGDYSLQINEKPNTQPYADYVFGRMMKLHLVCTEDGVEIPNTKPRPDYQSWCIQYPTYEALIQASIKSLEEEEIESK